MFLGCPGYPDCRYTRPVDDRDLPTPVEGTCPKCGASLVQSKGKFGRYIHCGRRPDCDFTKPFTGGVRCPKCGEGELAEKRGKRKTFYGCTRYPACDFIEWDLPRPIPCPAGCGSAYLVEKTSKRKGLVLRCPKCRVEHPPEAVSA